MAHLRIKENGYDKFFFEYKTSLEMTDDGKFYHIHLNKNAANFALITISRAELDELLCRLIDPESKLL